MYYCRSSVYISRDILCELLESMFFFFYRSSVYAHTDSWQFGKVRSIFLLPSIKASRTLPDDHESAKHRGISVRVPIGFMWHIFFHWDYIIFSFENISLKIILETFYVSLCHLVIQNVRSIKIASISSNIIWWFESHH